MLKKSPWRKVNGNVGYNNCPIQAGERYYNRDAETQRNTSTPSLGKRWSNTEATAGAIGNVTQVHIESDTHPFCDTGTNRVWHMTLFVTQVDLKYVTLLILKHK